MHTLTNNYIAIKFHFNQQLFIVKLSLMDKKCEVGVFLCIVGTVGPPLSEYICASYIIKVFR